MNVESQIGIAAPAQRIWQVWTDVEHWSDWTPSVTWIRRLDTGDFGVGSRATVKQPSMQSLVWEVTECTPGESFVWTTRTAGTTLVAGHRVAPAEDGTSTATFTISHTGLLAPALDLLIGGRIKRYLALEADGIRRYCEAA
ncbi:MAG TPA: SRPBCC family protein [Actinocatenispora sp.]